MSACVVSWNPSASVWTQAGKKRAEEDGVEGGGVGISGLSVILNDTIKRGRKSHFIRARELGEVMISRRPRARTRTEEPAGELKINADCQSASL